MTQTSQAPVPPRFAVRAAVSLRSAIQRLAERIAPPYARTLELGFGFQGAMLLRIACKYRVADLIHQSGPKTAAELAGAVGNIHVDTLHRVLRALASFGVFELDESGRFRNNRVSETLRHGIPGSLHAWVMYVSSKSNLEAWMDLERTVETGHNGFERIHGKDIWAYFAEHSDEGQTFNQAMVDLTDLQAPAVAAAYNFGNYRIICDVAGGRGSMLASILVKYPGVRGWLMDEPQVLEHAGAFLASRGIVDRVDRKPGNMFVEVPRGADAYMLKDIIHDWDDARSLKILENCRKAMDPGHRLLLVEMVMDPNSTQLPEPILDTHMMMTTCDGRQRSEEELRRLLEKSGFRLERIVTSAMPSSVVEGIAV